MTVFSPEGLTSGAASTCATHSISSDAWAMTLLSGAASARALRTIRAQRSRRIVPDALLKSLLRRGFIDPGCLAGCIRTGETEGAVVGDAFIVFFHFPQLQYQLCVRL